MPFRSRAVRSSTHSEPRSRNYKRIFTVFAPSLPFIDYRDEFL